MSSPIYNVNTLYTTKLFHKKYLYKIVLRVDFSRYFRSILKDHTPWSKVSPYSLVLNGEEKYKKLCNIAKIVTEYEHQLRITTPWITIYTNEFNLIHVLCMSYNREVKYLSIPETDTISNKLSANTVYIQGCTHKYKVILGTTTQNFDNFIKWADNHNKVELSQSARNQLSRDSTRNTSWIYVADTDTLTLVRMFLGNVIKDIYTIISE